MKPVLILDYHFGKQDQMLEHLIPLPDNFEDYNDF